MDRWYLEGQLTDFDRTIDRFDRTINRFDRTIDRRSGKPLLWTKSFKNKKSFKNLIPTKRRPWPANHLSFFGPRA